MAMHATHSHNSADFKQDNLIMPTGTLAQKGLTDAALHPTSLFYFLGQMKTMQSAARLISY